MYLLDVNVLLAFTYQQQACHSRVRRWVRHVDSQHAEGWTFATYSIVELGFVRIAGGESRLAENLTVARADLSRAKHELRVCLLADDLALAYGAAA